MKLTGDGEIEKFADFDIKGGEHVGRNRHDTKTRYIYIPIFVFVN
jgi:hypothetical protein